MPKNEAVLGSGYVYIMAFDGTVPEHAEIEKDENLLGYIQGGATLTYTPTFYEAKDDMGHISKKMVTDEVATLKTGVMSFNGETLKELTSTARVTSAEGVRTVKIGGAANFDGAKYLIRFVHTDATYGKIRATIVGSNEAGFELAFVKDKETVINAEFKAQPLDDEGTLVIYEEEVVTE